MAGVHRVALVLSSWARRGVIGILAGVTVPLFSVAYLNRGGPGLSCESYGDGVSCLDAWDPWPLLAVGIALLITAGVFQARGNTDRGTQMSAARTTAVRTPCSAPSSRHRPG